MITKPTADLRAPKPRTSQISTITLKRQGCIDAELECPVYEVTFRNDGTATYIGYANDDFIGKFVAHYPQQEFGYLVGQVQRQQFFELPRVFASSPIEETVVLEVVTNEGSRVVTTYNWNGTPSELRALYALIDYETFQVEWDEAKD